MPDIAQIAKNNIARALLGLYLPSGQSISSAVRQDIANYAYDKIKETYPETQTNKSNND